MQDAAMGRRRSASSTSRIFQGLFALVFFGFMFYMISNYLKKPKDGSVADADTDPQTTVETPDASVVKSHTFSPSLTTTPAKSSLASAATNSRLTNGTTIPKQPEPTTGPAAREILDKVIAAYRNAPAYSDRGKLRIEYQIESRPLAEEFPWSTRWANDGRLQSNIFDAKVRSNGKLLSCFVSEIRTENLKNQQLFLSGNKLVQQLYRDSIASYYLNGGERIPVNETIVPNNTLLTPPAIGLLTRQASSPWLGSNVQPRRLKDHMFDGNECFVIQCPGGRVGDLIAWVDKRSSLIRKVKLPNTLLDPMLAADPNVRDLNLFAEFTAAAFNPGDVAFENVAPRKDVWPVREFVSPADPLPTNLLGEPVPEFTLIDTKRAQLTDKDIEGKPMALLFLDGSDSDTKLISRFDKLRNNLVSSGVRFAVVAGPNSIETSPTGSWVLSSAIQPAANKSKLLFLADMEGLAARSMEFATLPAVVAMDSKLNIQYADLLVKPAGYNGKLSVNDNWDTRFTAAISATSKGINVANDMRAKYRTYLDKYFADRKSRLVDFPGYTLPGRQSVAAIPAKVRREKTAQRSDLKLNPRLVWESKHLTKPGNVAIVPDENRRAKGLLILDGWQTVNLFSVNGKRVSRKRLEIPDGVALTTIRPLVSATGEQRFAMFSVGGRKIYLFDASMDLVDTFPKQGSTRNDVLACEVLAGSRGSSDQLIVCFGGSGGATMFDTFSGKSRSIGETSVRALALSGRSVIAADERSGALLSMDNNGRVIDDRHEYSHVKSGATGGSSFAATAMSSNGEWSVVLIDSALKVKRSFPISSAIFQNGLEPISGIATADGKGTWAIADSGNRIYLLSDEGIWLGDMATDGNVSGMKLLTIDGRTRLVVSTDKKVECWELNFAPERVGATSQQRN